MEPAILPFEGTLPRIDDSAWIAPTGCVIGDVEIGPESSIWYGVTVRGDVNWIRIGARTNIQDHSMVHVTRQRFPTTIGDRVLIGHLVMVHGCTLEDDCILGMKSCVMDGAVIESGGMLAAGALLSPGKRIPAGELWGGVPARRIREVSEDERAEFRRIIDHYVALKDRHVKSLQGS